MESDMRVLRNVAMVVAAMLAAGGFSSAQAGEESRPAPAPQASESSRLEAALEKAARAAAAGIERGLQAAEQGARTGAVAAARGIERGAQATARAADQVARHLERVLRPAPPPGSERTGAPAGQGGQGSRGQSHT